MAGYYRIVEAQLRLVKGLGGHDLIAVLNPAGKVLRSTASARGSAAHSDGTDQ